MHGERQGSARARWTARARRCGGVLADILLVVPVAGRGEEPAALPDIEQILARYAEALGGAETVRQLRSLQLNGVFELPELGIKGALQVFAKAPNKAALVMRTPDDQLFTIVGFNGARGWRQALRRDKGCIEISDITGDELRQLRLTSEFYRELDLARLYPKLAVKGADTIEGHAVYVVEASPPEGPSERDSGLLRRRDALVADEQGNTVVQEYLDDYRPVARGGGIRIPFAHTLIYPEQADRNLFLKVNEAIPNATLPDASFERPRR